MQFTSLAAEESRDEDEEDDASGSKGHKEEREVAGSEKQKRRSGRRVIMGSGMESKMKEGLELPFQNPSEVYYCS